MHRVSHQEPWIIRTRRMNEENRPGLLSLGHNEHGGRTKTGKHVRMDITRLISNHSDKLHGPNTPDTSDWTYEIQLGPHPRPHLPPQGWWQVHHDRLRQHHACRPRRLPLRCHQDGQSKHRFFHVERTSVMIFTYSRVVYWPDYYFIH